DDERGHDDGREHIPRTLLRVIQPLPLRERPLQSLDQCASPRFRPFMRDPRMVRGRGARRTGPAKGWKRYLKVTLNPASQLVPGPGSKKRPLPSFTMTEPT